MGPRLVGTGSVGPTVVSWRTRGALCFPAHAGQTRLRSYVALVRQGADGRHAWTGRFCFLFASFSPEMSIPSAEVSGPAGSTTFPEQQTPEPRLPAGGAGLERPAGLTAKMVLTPVLCTHPALEGLLGVWVESRPGIPGASSAQPALGPPFLSSLVIFSRPQPQSFFPK